MLHLLNGAILDSNGNVNGGSGADGASAVTYEKGLSSSPSASSLLERFWIRLRLLHVKVMKKVVYACNALVNLLVTGKWRMDGMYGMDGDLDDSMDDFRDEGINRGANMVGLDVDADLDLPYVIDKELKDINITSPGPGGPSVGHKQGIKTGSPDPTGLVGYTFGNIASVASNILSNLDSIRENVREGIKGQYNNVNVANSYPKVRSIARDYNPGLPGLYWSKLNLLDRWAQGTPVVPGIHGTAVHDDGNMWMARGGDRGIDSCTYRGVELQPMSVSHLFMLAIPPQAQHPPNQPGDDFENHKNKNNGNKKEGAQCLRVDGTVGECDLSALYAYVYLPPAPYLSQPEPNSSMQDTYSPVGDIQADRSDKKDDRVRDSARGEVLRNPSSAANAAKAANPSSAANAAKAATDKKEHSGLPRVPRAYERGSLLVAPFHNVISGGHDETANLSDITDFAEKVNDVRVDQDLELIPLDPAEPRDLGRALSSLTNLFSKNEDRAKKEQVDLTKTSRSLPLPASANAAKLNHPNHPDDTISMDSMNDVIDTNGRVNMDREIRCPACLARTTERALNCEIYITAEQPSGPGDAPVRAVSTPLTGEGAWHCGATGWILLALPHNEADAGNTRGDGQSNTHGDTRSNRGILVAHGGKVCVSQSSHLHQDNSRSNEQYAVDLVSRGQCLVVQMVPMQVHSSPQRTEVLRTPLQAPSIPYNIRDTPSSGAETSAYYQYEQGLGVMLEIGDGLCLQGVVGARCSATTVHQRWRVRLDPARLENRGNVMQLTTMSSVRADTDKDMNNETNKNSSEEAQHELCLHIELNQRNSNDGTPLSNDISDSSVLSLVKCDWADQYSHWVFDSERAVIRNAGVERDYRQRVGYKYTCESSCLGIDEKDGGRRRKRKQDKEAGNEGSTAADIDFDEQRVTLVNCDAHAGKVSVRA